MMWEREKWVGGGGGGEGDGGGGGGGGGGERWDWAEDRAETRIRREAQIISFSFSLHFAGEPRPRSTAAFHMDEVPECRSAARWHRSVGKWRHDLNGMGPVGEGQWSVPLSFLLPFSLLTFFSSPAKHLNIHNKPQTHTTRENVRHKTSPASRPLAVFLHQDNCRRVLAPVSCLVFPDDFWEYEGLCPGPSALRGLLSSLSLGVAPVSSSSACKPLPASIQHVASVKCVCVCVSVCRRKRRSFQWGWEVVCFPFEGLYFIPYVFYVCIYSLWKLHQHLNCIREERFVCVVVFVCMKEPRGELKKTLCQFLHLWVEMKFFFLSFIKNGERRTFTWHHGAGWDLYFPEHLHQFRLNWSFVFL